MDEWQLFHDVPPEWDPESAEDYPYLGEWYALHTTDRDAVLAEFGLSDPVPARPQEWYQLQFSDEVGPDKSVPSHDRQCRRAFVTTPKDGWTLVFGTMITEAQLPQHTCGRATESASDVADRLSKRFGRAYAFQWTPSGIQSIWEDYPNWWYLAEEGRMVECFDMEPSELASDGWVRCGAVDPDRYRLWVAEVLLDPDVREDMPARPNEDLMDWARRWCAEVDEDYPGAGWVEDLGPLNSVQVCARLTTWFREDDPPRTLALTACGRHLGTAVR